MRTAALIAPLAGLAGCSSADDAGVERASLRVGLSVPAMRETSIGLGFHKLALTRETLITIGDDGHPAPRILESWEATPDRLVWRLKLRPGVRFHDGTPVTAHALAPHMAERFRTISMGSVKAVEAASDDTVVVTLNEPYAFLFEDIALISPVRTAGNQQFGTGPYIVEAESPERLLLKASPVHYRGEPAISEIEVRLYPDQRNAWSAMMRDEVDVLYDVSRESLDFVRRESSVAVSTFTRPFVYLLGLNHAHPALRDARVRRALDLAVDRDALVRSGLVGEGEPAGSHIWPRHWAYDAASSSARFDPAAAVRLLEEAGRSIQTERGRMPARLRLRCLVYEPFRKIALGLQRQLAAIDVDLQLELVPLEQMLKRFVAGDFESFVLEMNSGRGFKYPYEFWHSSTPRLKHGYRAADPVLDRLRRASTDEEFRAAVADLQRLFRNDPPAVFLAWGHTSRAVSRRFAFEPTRDDVYHSISRWAPVGKAN